jgi:CBS domain-containing protein
MEEARAMLCQDLMKKDARCCSPRDTVQDAAVVMRDAGIGFLPVCDESMQVFGTLTDRDIAIRVVAAGKSNETLIEEVMTREIIHCRPDDELEKAERLMAMHHKSRIVCRDEYGSLLGVISLSDIAKHLGGSEAAETLRRVAEREART